MCKTLLFFNLKSYNVSHYGFKRHFLWLLSKVNVELGTDRIIVHENKGQSHDLLIKMFQLHLMGK